MSPMMMHMFLPLGYVYLDAVALTHVSLKVKLLHESRYYREKCQRWKLPTGVTHYRPRIQGVPVPVHPGPSVGREDVGGATMTMDTVRRLFGWLRDYQTTIQLTSEVSSGLVPRDCFTCVRGYPHTERRVSRLTIMTN